MKIPHIIQIQTAYGMFFIDSQSDEKMAVAMRQKVYLNENLLAVTRQFVNKKSMVIDIGAHIGTFAIPIAAKIEEVIAFEPSPEAAALLARNARENNVELEIIAKALGSKKGSGTLFVRNTSNAGANTLVAGGDIPVTTLDDEVAHADFIKIDVEGMELEVLHGGTRLIERARPVVLFEVNLSQLRAHSASPRALGQFFIRRGYRLYFPLDAQVARVRSAQLVTMLIAPRAWFTHTDSAPFDLLAVPRERPLPVPCRGFVWLIGHLIGENLAAKRRRLARIFLRK